MGTTRTTRKKRPPSVAKPRGACTPDPGAAPAHAGTANLRPWKPGQSGNPKGRTPAQYSVAKLAREHGDEAIATLVLLMRGQAPPGCDPPDAKVAGDAARTLIDRGYGKSLSQTAIMHELGASPETESFIAALRDISRRPRLDVVEGVVIETPAADAPDTEDPD